MEGLTFAPIGQEASIKPLAKYEKKGYDFDITNTQSQDIIKASGDFRDSNPVSKVIDINRKSTELSAKTNSFLNKSEKINDLDIQVNKDQLELDRMMNFFTNSTFKELNNTNKIELFDKYCQIHENFINSKKFTMLSPNEQSDYYACFATIWQLKNQILLNALPQAA